MLDIGLQPCLPARPREQGFSTAVDTSENTPRNCPAGLLGWGFQPGGQLGVPAFLSEVRGRLALVVGHVRMGAVVHQQFAQVFPVGRGCGEDPAWKTTRLGRVGVGPVRDQQLDR